MKTDSLFYNLFQQLPGLIFELSGWQVERPQDYRFQSVELKQTAFRLDGLFTPPKGDEISPLLFAEVQFQPDEGLYGRMFAELFLYLRQFRPKNPWRVVVIYPSQATEQIETRHYQGLLQLPEVQRIYLDRLPDCPQDSLGLRLVRLIVQDAGKAVVTARDLAGQVKLRHPNSTNTVDLLELIETILIYKFPQLSREEIQKMLDFTYSDLKQTRFYQDVFG
jgi:predicted transposase/invertase (TIGR01784 family)